MKIRQQAPELSGIRDDHVARYQFLLDNLPEEWGTNKVLDVGCGLGGSAFVMAREFNLNVDGIDLSKNMLALANAKLVERGLEDRVRLEWGDCLELDRPDCYDAIYSRDVFLHMQEFINP